MPPAAGGFPQTPLTEEFETQEVREQEVREQLYICEVLHVGLKPQHAAPHKWCQDKSKDRAYTLYYDIFRVHYIFTVFSFSNIQNRACTGSSRSMLTKAAE